MQVVHSACCGMHALELLNDKNDLPSVMVFQFTSVRITTMHRQEPNNNILLRIL